MLLGNLWSYTSSITGAGLFQGCWPTSAGTCLAVRATVHLVLGVASLSSCTWHVTSADTYCKFGHSHRECVLRGCTILKAQRPS